MLVLEELCRISTDRVRRRVVLDGASLEFVAHLVEHTIGIRAVNIEGVSPRETYNLSNSDQFNSLYMKLWHYMDGTPLGLPCTL